MKKSKVLLTLLCAVALVATSVFGTLAYLTSTDEVKNTFTVGNVAITLDELDVDNDDNKGDNKTYTVNGVNVIRDKANAYKLMPGHEYDKDPTVTVLKDSESSYVRMLMTVRNASAVQAIIDADDKDGSKGAVVDYADLFKGWKNDKWLYEGFTTKDNTITFEFRYYTAVAAPGSDVTLEPLFTQLVVPGYVTNDQIAALYGTLTDAEGDFVVDVVAHAIQASGFEGDAAKGLTAEDVAWAAFDAQN